MRLDKFTIKVQEALQVAQRRAETLKSAQLEPEHLLEALAMAGGRHCCSPAEKTRSVDRFPAFRTRPAFLLAAQSRRETAFSSHKDWMRFSRRPKKKRTSSKMNTSRPSTFCWPWPLRTVSPANSCANRGRDRDSILKVLASIRGGQRVTDPNAEEKYQALKRYARDLTDLARRGKLDPVIGRDDEIRRVIQVLSRRTKNNPVSDRRTGCRQNCHRRRIGATHCRRRRSRRLSRKKQMVALDLGGMLAGAKYRGEFEDRLKAVLREIEESAGAIVLFIDELHTLVGAGAAEGAIDASNMLKPALARGELRCIGATTLNEYKKYIEKDAALERRFQPVLCRRAFRGRHHRHPARTERKVRSASRSAHHRLRNRRGCGSVPPLHRRSFSAGQSRRSDG